jgi:hypothetical protein
MGACIGLNMSTPWGTELHLDVSTLRATEAFGAPGRIYITVAWTAPVLFWTKWACADHGRFYTTGAWAAPGRNCTRVAVALLLLDVSTLRGPELHIDDFRNLCCYWTCPHNTEACTAHEWVSKTGAWPWAAPWSVWTTGAFACVPSAIYEILYMRKCNQLGDTEFHEITRNLSQFTEHGRYGSTKNMGNFVLIELRGHHSANWRRYGTPSFVIPCWLVIRNHSRDGSADAEIISALAQSKGK